MTIKKHNENFQISNLQTNKDTITCLLFYRGNYIT